MNQDRIFANMGISWLLIFMGSLLLVSACVGQVANQNMQHIEKVEIHKVDFLITTFTKISCASYDNYFNNMKKTVVLENNKKIAHLLSLLMNVKESKDELPDVRAKVLLYHSSGQIDVICLSNLRMSINGKPIEYNSAIAEYVKSQ